MTTALIFWVFCVAYPIFTLLQSLALIWLIWRFRNEIFQKMPNVPLWISRNWCTQRLPHWSPHTTIEEPAIDIQVDEGSSLASEVHA